MQELKRFQTNVNFHDDQLKLERFFLFYTEENSSPKYITKIQELINLREKSEVEDETILKIYLDDLAIFSDDNLIERFENNSLTYLDLLYKAIDKNCPQLPTKDMLYYHRLERLKEKLPDSKLYEILPAVLTRKYFLEIVGRTSMELRRMRSIKADQIGKFVRFKGIVTKSTATKPFIRVCTYICDSCGSETYVETFSETFDLLEECISEKCRSKKMKGSLNLQTRGSSFSKFQKLKVQEIMSETIHGSVPISIDVECYDSLVNKVRPGETVIITGVFVAREFEGMAKIKAGLLRDSFIYATNISKLNEMPEKLTDLNLNANNFSNINVELLVKSFAPNIYGMKDIKKLILLLLLGSPSIKTEDKMFVRGNINILLVGDPGIAKSQLLKEAIRLCDGVYTTGYGSSSAGLTAAVMKDSATGEPILEGGALVLADNSVCAIDEFDKMSEIDRTSVHEVMEQHTVSISKAGINATLNARTSILAAANPLGNFNKKFSLSKNLNMPVSLLSRFDAIFIIEDTPDEDVDKMLAEHICGSFTKKEEEKLEDDLLDFEFLHNFVMNAKKITPKLSKELKNKLISHYLESRKNFEHLTPRYLLSIIRLSFAHSRLRFSEVVDEFDVDEVIRLVSSSNYFSEKRKSKSIPKYEIFNNIKSLLRNNTVDVYEIYSLLGGTYSKDKIADCINDFTNAGIWEVKDGVLEYLDL